MTRNGQRTLWTFAITSLALFMTTLDNLVVTMALPTIQRDLHASISGLEWTVNAYTLTFAVLLLMGAALGDRFGRKRMFLIGMAIFTAGSAGAALAPSIGGLIAARAIQGVGGAIVTPLTLTLLTEAVPRERRGLALGAWGGISGLGVALGPLVGGAVVEGISWQWIFWLNVPLGLIVLPMGLARLRESRGPAQRLDLPGVAIVTAGAFGLVWGLVRANSQGWTSPEIVGSIAAGVVLLVAFVAWELRTSAPMLPMRLFRNRAFSAANGSSLLMFFGMFGSIFLLSQYLQNVQGYSPLAAGVRTLPWTGMPMIVAPIAGAMTDRIGGKPLLVAGLALQAMALGWMAFVISPNVPYPEIAVPFALAGVGMGLFFAPVATVVMSSVRLIEAGQASGANNAIRELGGVFGVAVLASIFAHQGGYGSAALFTDGIRPALWVGAALVAGGMAAALVLPGRGATPAEAGVAEGELEPVAA